MRPTDETHSIFFGSPPIKSTNFFTNKPPEGGCIPKGQDPIVTIQIQICCYNEEAVIEATLDAACSVDWPKDKLFIQVLDDSTDRTSQIVEDVAASWRERGVHCVRYTSPDRVDYKAGNLHANLAGSRRLCCPF